jgi:hypothetical protein
MAKVAGESLHGSPVGVREICAQPGDHPIQRYIAFGLLGYPQGWSKIA